MPEVVWEAGRREGAGNSWTDSWGPEKDPESRAQVYLEFGLKQEVQVTSCEPSPAQDGL